MKAIGKGAVMAESDDTVGVEGNHDFPPASVKAESLAPSDTTTFCSWNGAANHASLSVDGQSNRDAVRYYAGPKDAAKPIRGRVAFRTGVKVTD